MNKNSDSPFTAALIGAIIGTLATLTAVYLAKEENRKKLSDAIKESKNTISNAYENSKNKISENSYNQRNEISKNLRRLADQLENA